MVQRGHAADGLLQVCPQSLKGGKILLSQRREQLGLEGLRRGRSQLYPPVRPADCEPPRLSRAPNWGGSPSHLHGPKSFRALLSTGRATRHQVVEVHPSDLWGGVSLVARSYREIVHRLCCGLNVGGESAYGVTKSDVIAERREALSEFGLDASHTQELRCELAERRTCPVKHFSNWGVHTSLPARHPAGIIPAHERLPSEAYRAGEGSFDYVQRCADRCRRRFRPRATQPRAGPTVWDEETLPPPFSHKSCLWNGRS